LKVVFLTRIATVDNCAEEVGNWGNQIESKQPFYNSVACGSEVSTETAGYSLKAGAYVSSLVTSHNSQRRRSSLVTRGTLLTDGASLVKQGHNTDGMAFLPSD